MQPSGDTALDEPEYRFERKALLRDVDLPDVLRVIRCHDAFFREIHGERQINNIYFDTTNLSAFSQNIDGDSDRTKYRVRWYGDLTGTATRPVLELKSRHGTVGSKSRYPIEPFEVSSGFDTRDLDRAFDASGLPPGVRMALRDRRPWLMNRYRRRYFSSVCRRYRVTLDWDLEFYGLNVGPNLLRHRYADRTALVFEIKYDRADDSGVEQIIEQLPFSLTKNSKYVHGVQGLWAHD